jgi:tight adherence protein C
MGGRGSLTWTVFVMVSSLTMLIALLVTGRKNRANARLQELASGGKAIPEPDPVAEFTRLALPKMGVHLIPKDEKDRTRLKARLLQAGLYGRQAMVVFLGVKMFLIVAPALVGLAAGLVGLISVRYGLVFGGILSLVGMVGPSFWLDRKKSSRQTQFRRALPDALDVMVICLEAGLSLPGALRRVPGELRTVHPALAAELNIVQREVQLGLSTGEALRQFAERADLEEIRSLASVVLQSERFGASLVKALRVHAETLRGKRLQYAEEMAQKAAIKVLFPTLFFIFPGIFMVILGPAVIQIIDLFSQLNL